MSLATLEDPIAELFYRDEWEKLVHESPPKHRPIADRIIKGLAVLMRTLLIRYNEKKKDLRTLLLKVSALTGDYDSLREDGVDLRHTKITQNLSFTDKAKVTEILEFLEKVAPGLLIILRPDLLRIALAHEFHLLVDGRNALMHPQAMGKECRERFISLLKGQVENHADYINSCIELFKILCEEDNGPWNTGFKSNTNLRQLHAVYVLLCEATERKVQRHHVEETGLACRNWIAGPLQWIRPDSPIAVSLEDPLSTSHSDSEGSAIESDES